ncbi:secreted RxLR effector protein 161-like [Solanum dulcamara]|uniref:secreted RxLR effector protein 161-like n=1 Tax=Solanum dulcamara TaxID=45834 RepID=UPI002484E3FA|nr:secreted RxLR effector protein 161-like [Solanum dulcamara]
MLITGSSLKLIEDTKQALQRAFKMKDLGELKYFLGIEFSRTTEGILMHQMKYTLELIAELEESADPLIDQFAYQKLIGKLLYLNMTRPDISFSTQTLSQFLNQPKKSHMEVALRVVKYLKRQPGQGILLSSQSDRKVTAFCDADWVACSLTSKSVTGYMIKIGKSLVSWKVKKQTTLSRSSAEAEYRSMASIISKLVWLLGMLKEVDADVELHVQMYSDSKTAIQIVANPIYHEKQNI